jgi:hypothetical protein
VLTDWNGLMIAALAVGSRVLDEPRYADEACRAADFLFAYLKEEDGRLLKRWRLGEAGIDGTLDDHAFLAWGLIELYEATFDPRYLAEARGLARAMIEQFRDDANGGFFLPSEERTDLLVRPKEAYDGAIPSGNSVAGLVFLRLGRMTGDTDLERECEKILRAFSESINRAPSSHSQMLLALDFLSGPSYEVVIAGKGEGADTQEMLHALRRPFLPRKVVIFRPTDRAGDDIVELAGFIRNHTSRDGRATAYVCRSFACRTPTTDPGEMLGYLQPETGERVASD